MINDKESRPVRLSGKTRRFAAESMACRYGKETRANWAVELDGLEGFEQMTELEKYDRAIAEITAHAPVRICEGELLSGAATLGMAMEHFVPVKYKGEFVFRSVSHLTLDFGWIVRSGINRIEEQIRRSAYKQFGGEEDRDKNLMKSMLNCMQSFRVWHGRYLETLRGMEGYEQNVRVLERVPLEPPVSFREAVQSLWFVFAFLRLCGNWPGIGRLDDILGEYLQKDLEEGVLDIEEAREILAHFFIKGCEWVRGEDSRGTGDAQHYANIILSGVDERGNDLTNEVTYLVLDIIEELGISEFPVSVRLNRKTDGRLMRRLAEVIRYGGGVLAIYNEDLVLDALTGYGYELREARHFTNDGCWEVEIPGRTYFTYHPFDALRILQQETLKGYEPVEYPDFEALYAQFIQDLKGYVEKVYEDRASENGWLTARRRVPSSALSMFIDDCIESGRSYYDHGTKYNIYSPHIGGLPDAANSLYAIRKLVFEEGRLALNEFLEILKNDWDGQEALRQYLLHHYSYFGNDNDEVDELVCRIVSDFAEICHSVDLRNDVQYPGGISTFTREVEWLPDRLASAHGRKKGEILAANLSPTPGSELLGATAVIKSYCKPDLKRLPTGSALDVKLFPASVANEEGLTAIQSLLQGFLALKGFFMQIDVVDNEVLRRAQEDPEAYATLSVRVSGWNARFVTLRKEYQDMVIARSYI